MVGQTCRFAATPRRSSPTFSDRFTQHRRRDFDGAVKRPENCEKRADEIDVSQPRINRGDELGLEREEIVAAGNFVLRPENDRAARDENAAENQHRQKTERRIHRNRSKPPAIDVGRVVRYRFQLRCRGRRATGLAPTLVA